MAEFPWTGNRCILCLRTFDSAVEDSQATGEHIIPEKLGGRLWARFLCKRCNSKLGTEVEAEAKKDPRIRLAIESLAHEIPDLTKALSEGQDYIAKSPNGTVRGKIRNNEFYADPGKLNDGSLILSREHNIRLIKKHVTQYGGSEELVKIALNKLGQAPPNLRTEIAPGLEVIKWTNQPLAPALDGQMIGEILPLKIAFEYLACWLNLTIYDPGFDEYRHIILNNGSSSELFRVEQGRAGKYAPFHGLAHEQGKPYVIIQIRLFGVIAFKVHFPKIAVNGDRFAYTLDLHDKREHLSIICPPPLVEGGVTAPSPIKQVE